MKFSQKIFLTVVICIIFITLSINHEDNRSIKILEIAQAKSADTALWDNESYTWFATIIGSFAKVLQNQPSKSQAER
ncbi:hypothetical protein VU04_07260 [Desulfobulbus sp. TB]|nr:hypothetical protein [Desulfobulbus sp. TB]